MDVTKVEYFENGIRRFTSQEDQSADGSAKNWQTRETEYDENGKLITRTTEYDNGLKDFSVYENGSKIFRLQEDNSANGTAASWQFIETTYDENGTIQLSQTLFDNDVFEFVGYHNGISVERNQTDQSADGLAENWQSFTTHYDENGVIERSNILYDDATL